MTPAQRSAMEALHKLADQGFRYVRARDVASVTGQSPQGAAITLAALERAEFVRNPMIGGGPRLYILATS